MIAEIKGGENMNGNLKPQTEKTRSYKRQIDFTTIIPFTPKNKDQEEAFKRATWWSQKHMKKGDLDWYSYDLKHMATLFDREQRYNDKAKVLMVAFYIDLSGVKHSPFVDRALICMMKSAVKKSGMDTYQFREMYLDAVRTDITPRHIMSVSDSLYLLELALEGRDHEVGTIIDGFRLANGVK